MLDAFVGSGSTAISALNLGRQFVGSEIGDVEFGQALARLEKEVE